MSKTKGQAGSETVNTGGAPKPTAEERARKFQITGNAAAKGEKPSPAERERGEASSADPKRPIDIDRDRER